ncbi:MULTISPECIES: ParB/RepB/Spo0J family partition protein [Methylorubrum]|jgi:ParB family chromosome partitioning protein|nr:MULTISPECIES: ParB/RepB/Spo0J family partition protein [Methylorubrum]KQP93404.1 chromosome partitioning protein ParB [Methylobacterium sp. Leaf119]MBA9069793.1 ParB family chromosome partitioning protein [Methylobacterium sp. RAS18]APX87773.1 chromosome partitioning protein ParB [Methylorubrum extorquens]MCG5245900.1 ParB/RepB/Spo0J family partition protein [Methylorubrum extorquens]MCY1641325.1 ParB/RepB/Spo0J family partition protein [Methylorubrum sp. SL192]
MADDTARPRLGRGLAALIGDFSDDAPEEAARTAGHAQRKVAVEFLRPNPRNPRRRFSEPELDELAASIRQRGVIQPIVVRALSGVPGTFEIVAGERRWRAAQRAGLNEVPVVVVEIDDRTSLEYAILENVQRADLNAIEEASGYERLMGEFKYTQAELADLLGKSRSHLANTLRLLQLPPAIQDRVIASEITAGHARALLSVRDPEAVARRIVAEGLSVREVEALAAAEAPQDDTPRPGRPRRSAEGDAALRSLEDVLGRALGYSVAVKAKASGEGEIRIRYTSAEERDALCRKLGGA